MRTSFGATPPPLGDVRFFHFGHFSWLVAKSGGNIFGAGGPAGLFFRFVLGRGGCWGSALSFSTLLSSGLFTPPRMHSI